MRRHLRTALCFAALLLAGAGGGCHRSNSFLLVEVASDLRLMPVQFAVAVRLEKANQIRSFNIPPEPSIYPIALPTSFSIELDRSATGPVNVSVTAYGELSVGLGEGSTTQDHIKVGDDTIVVVWLNPADGIIPDGGAPDPTGAGGEGGSGGSGGAAGTGGTGGIDAGDSDADIMDANDQ